MRLQRFEWSFRRLGVRLGVGLALLAALGGCPPTAPVSRAPAPELAGGTWGSFRTMKAEHRVTVEAKNAQGGTETRTLRGLLAVERPGRFRLRALGPAGITFFDLLYVDGDVQVIQALGDPRATTLSQLLKSIAGDLALAYDLRPRPEGRCYRMQGTEIVGSEPGRSVRLEEFRRVPGGVAPERILIENERGYRVDIEASRTTLDEQLDEALFRR